MTLLRQSLIKSHLNTLEYNLSRGTKDIFIYEISNVYYEENNKEVEETKLCITAYGNYINNSWNKINVETDYFLLKGIVENLLIYLGYKNIFSFEVNSNISFM